MTNREKRALVAALYPGDNWQRKVAKMSDEQVVAIYLRALEIVVGPPSTPPTEPEQLRLF